MAATFDISGHCLCGAVTYRAKAASHDVSACHCGMCRRWTGGPLIYIDVVGKPELTGADAIGVYRSSETGERGFCIKCGSVLFWKTAGKDIYTFTAGSLDDQASLVFARQIYIEDKPDFYDFANDTIKQTGAEGMQAYAGSPAKTE
jgi:hypothetical protein